MQRASCRDTGALATAAGGPPRSTPTFGVPTEFAGLQTASYTTSQYLNRATETASRTGTQLFLSSPRSWGTCLTDVPSAYGSGAAYVRHNERLQQSSSPGWQFEPVKIVADTGVIALGRARS